MDDLNSEPTVEAAPEPVVESVIVQAVGTAVTASNVPGLSARIEAAQVAAVEECFAEGITDSAEIIARKMAARDAVLAAIAVPAELPES